MELIRLPGKSAKMKEEDIQASILNFYSKNEINPERYTDDRDRQYKEGLDYDSKIYQPNLEAALAKWLENYEERDKDYYLRMFGHFTYLTQRYFEYRVFRLKEYVFDELSEYQQDKIMIVFSESAKGYKSGASQMSAAWWKACDSEMGKDQLIEICSKVPFGKVAQMEAIVFVDDIVATGVTLKGTIEAFFDRFPKDNFVHTKFFATGVMATKRGKRHIGQLKKEGLPVTWIYNQEEYEYLPQAFKGDHIFSAAERKEAEKAVLRYEEEVGKDEDGKSYVMGYEKSKLLVGFHYEIPNNTLCTFWRHGKTHVPLFERSGNQNISLQEVINKRKKMRRNAYKIASMKGKNESK